MQVFRPRTTVTSTVDENRFTGRQIIVNFQNAEGKEVILESSRERKREVLNMKNQKSEWLWTFSQEHGKLWKLEGHGIKTSKFWRKMMSKPEFSTTQSMSSVREWNEDIFRCARLSKICLLCTLPQEATGGRVSWKQRSEPKSRKPGAGGNETLGGERPRVKVAQRAPVQTRASQKARGDVAPRGKKSTESLSLEMN